MSYKRNKTGQELDDISQFLEGKTSGDDKGLTVTDGQLVVRDGEVIMGNQDSYPVPIAFHFDYSNLSGTTITGATDVTEILASEDASTIGLFGGTAVDNCILVGSLLPYGGVKAKIDTLGVVEADNVIAEYLQDDTPTWVGAKYMATDAEFPLEQKGNNLATCASCSEQWYFGFDPNNIPTAWANVTLNINGTDYTYKWALFRITSAITTDPLMEQIKLHTNRFEINVNGVSQYFGLSRYPKTLNTTVFTNADKNPLNENISLATGVTLVVINNEFTANANDGFVIQGNVPVGLDTSIPLTVNVEWYPAGAGAGDVELEAELIKVKNGFTFDGAATKQGLLPVVTPLNIQLEKRIKNSFQFFIDDLVPGDQWYISLFRDATAGNTEDTFGSSIIITFNESVGHFWKP